MKDASDNHNVDNSQNPDTDDETMVDQSRNHNEDNSQNRHLNPDTDDEEMRAASENHNVDNLQNPDADNEMVDPSGNVNQEDAGNIPRNLSEEPAPGNGDNGGDDENIIDPDGDDNNNQAAIPNLLHLDLEDYESDNDDDYDPDNREHHQLGYIPIFGPSQNARGAAEEKAAAPLDNEDIGNDNGSGDNDNDGNNEQQVIHVGMGIWSPNFERAMMKKIADESGLRYTLSQALKNTLQRTLQMRVDQFVDFRFHDGPRRVGWVLFCLPLPL